MTGSERAPTGVRLRRLVATACHIIVRTVHPVASSTLCASSPCSAPRPGRSILPQPAAARRATSAPASCTPSTAVSPTSRVRCAPGSFPAATQVPRRRNRLRGAVAHPLPARHRHRRTERPRPPRPPRSSHLSTRRIRGRRVTRSPSCGAPCSRSRSLRSAAWRRSGSCAGAGADQARSASTRPAVTTHEADVDTSARRSVTDDTTRKSVRHSVGVMSQRP